MEAELRGGFEELAGGAWPFGERFSQPQSDGMQVGGVLAAQFDGHVFAVDGGGIPGDGRGGERAGLLDGVS